MTRLSVLYVDDDRSNLLAMQYALGDDLDFRIADSGSQALERAEGIDVLLADQRMPGMSGVEVCRRFREVCPDAARILYTAYPDPQAGVAAINEGAVSRLLVKPMVNEELLRAIIESYETRRLERNAALRSLVASGPARARRAIELQLGRAMSGIMGVLFDQSDDRDCEYALRSAVVSLQAGTLMVPFRLGALKATGLNVQGDGAVGLNVEALVHALVLLDPNRVEIEEKDGFVSVELRAVSGSSEAQRLATSILEFSGGHVTQRGQDVSFSARRETAHVDPQIALVRAPTLDMLVVGSPDSMSVPDGFAVDWTDPEGALQRVHDARCVMIDERHHEASICTALREQSSATLLLRVVEPDFARHRAFAGTIDCLIHDGQSTVTQHELMTRWVQREREICAERAALISTLRSETEAALSHGLAVWKKLRDRAQPLLTRDGLRDVWRSCEGQAWPST